MKLKTLSVMLVLFLVASAAWAEAVKVVAWNLEWFPGGSPNASESQKAEQMAAAKKALTSLNPDVFLAEEVADWTAFQELVSVVPKLHVQTVSAFRNADGTIGRQQVAIAAKLPANSTWAEEWKPGKVHPPRGFTFAALTLANKKLLFVYAVHLKSNSTGRGGSAEDNTAKRQESARQLASHCADMEKAYQKYAIGGIVIGGDFNTNQDKPQWKDESTLPTLEQAGFWNTWTGVKAEDRLTWKGSEQFDPVTFDFFMVKGLDHLQAQMAKPTEKVSDHQPVVLLLHFP